MLIQPYTILVSFDPHVPHLSLQNKHINLTHNTKQYGAFMHSGLNRNIKISIIIETEIIAPVQQGT